MTTLDRLEELGDRLQRATTADLRSEQRATRRLNAWPRWTRSRLTMGGSLGVASLGAALVVALGGSASPAFAVTRNHDGSVSVQIYRAAGVADANRRLAAMGIRARVEGTTGDHTVTISARCASTSPGAYTPRRLVVPAGVGGPRHTISSTEPRTPNNPGASAGYTGSGPAGNTGSVVAGGLKVVGCASGGGGDAGDTGAG